MYSKFLFLFAITALTIASCSKDYDELNNEEILMYLADNNITAEEHESGIYYTVTKTGDGNHPSASATVKVKYIGKLTDGTVFDQTTNDQSAEFPLVNLIQGWQIGIPLLDKGGKGTFYIPSSLGYGGQANGSIPANSVLIFDIELVDFN